jgi:hypothetical protein
VSAGEPCASDADVKVSESNSKQMIAIAISATAGKRLHSSAKDLGISRFLLLRQLALPWANKKNALLSDTLFINSSIEF